VNLKHDAGNYSRVALAPNCREMGFLSVVPIAVRRTAMAGMTIAI